MIQISLIRSLLFLAASLAAGMVSPSLAGGLFRTASPSEVEYSNSIAPPLPSDPDIKILRAGYVVVDPSYLSSHFAPADVKNLDGEEERTAAAEKLPSEGQIEIFPDLVLTSERITVRSSDQVAGSFYWLGSAKGRDCQIELFFESGVVSGEVSCLDTAKTYYINRIDRNIYRVIETSLVRVPVEPDDTFNPDSRNTR